MRDLSEGWWLSWSSAQVVRQHLSEIAIHEAGHAVLAWITGRRILQVSMVTDLDYSQLRSHRERTTQAGCIDLAPLSDGANLHEGKYRVLAEREAMIALAGDLAVFRFRGCRWRKNLSAGDLEGLTYAATHAGASQERLNSYLDRLASRTVLYLEVFWAHVEALAKALMHRREMTGQQVTAFLREVESQPTSPSSATPTKSRRHPPAERLGERPGVELGEHPLERVRAGDAVLGHKGVSQGARP